MKELIARLKGETPTHFKRIIYTAVTIGGVCAAVLALPITLPAVVITILQGGVTAGVVAAAVAKTAVKDPEQIIKELDKEKK